MDKTSKVTETQTVAVVETAVVETAVVETAVVETAVVETPVIDAPVVEHIGIDVSKDTLEVALKYDAKPFTVGNDLGGIAQLLKRLGYEAQLLRSKEHGRGKSWARGSDHKLRARQRNKAL